ncbi:MAG TPA: Gfo/Idh/MocA family oxidoreductase [Acidimicrobiales bacterium]|nr:Gfo/Idh/MocA family oxidoreductase [Acidimicrobiales bacterium]
MTDAPPLRIGLVGAGPWAAMLHAPMLARSPDVDLVGIWARRPEAAGALAERRHTKAFADLDALMDAVDALAFGVPPDVQCEFGIRAARAGKHLLLEKPLGLDLSGASELAAAIEESGVRSQMVLTRRYMPSTIAFLDRAAALAPYGGRAAAISGAVLGDAPFATPWRIAHGALLDVGPHVIDLLDAAIGPIGDISARGDPRRYIVLNCEHRNGAVSQAALSISQPMDGSIWTFELYGAAGVISLEDGGPDAADQYAAAVESIPRELAEVVRSGADHPFDARRGLHLQGLIERAQRSLA